MKKLFLLTLALLLFYTSSSFSDNTHGTPNPQKEMGAWFGNLASPYIASNCLPTVPSSSLTLAAFACSGYVRDSTGALVYVTQAAATITLANTNGVHWLAISQDTSSAVSSWTRRAGSHYLFRQVGAKPDNPTGALVFAKITVAASVITTVEDFRIPSSYVTAGVFDITDPLYGAVGNDATDATVSAQAALTAARDQAALSHSGQIVWVPTGTFLTSAQLNIYKYTTLRGTGYRTSIIHAAHTGNGVASTWPINSSTGVYINVEDIGFLGDNGNLQAAFVDLGGTFVNLTNVYVSKFKYGVIFDQTEIATIDKSVFDAQTLAGVWLVNGDRTASTTLNYTNRITITRNQFNHGAAAYNVIDDGGVSHVIRDNNFNGGLENYRLCGWQGGIMAGNEFEGSTSTALTLQKSTYAGTTHANIISPRGVVITGNVFAPVAGNIQVSVVDANTVTLESNFFGSDAASPGRVSITVLDTLLGIGNNFRGGPSNGGTYTGAATNHLVLDGDDLVGAVQVKPGLKYPNTVAGTGTSSSAIMNNYDQGTFTPSFVASGSTFVYETGGQKGWYTRIGNRVFVEIWLQLETSGNTLTSQAVAINGLPYTSDASGSPSAVNHGGFCTSIWGTFTTALYNVSGYIPEGTTQVRLYKVAAAAASTALLAADDMDPTGNSLLRMGCQYQTN